MPFGVAATVRRLCLGLDPPHPLRRARRQPSPGAAASSPGPSRPPAGLLPFPPPIASPPHNAPDPQQWPCPGEVPLPLRTPPESGRKSPSAWARGPSPKTPGGGNWTSDAHLEGAKRLFRSLQRIKKIM